MLDEEESKDDEQDYDLPNLYSILNLSQDATSDEVKRAYKTLSSSFHPDKVRLRPPPPSSSPSSQNTTQIPMIDTTQQLDEIQDTFLQFKKAHDVLIDPVFRLTYDQYGEDGVELIRRVQQQQREQKTRRDAAAAAAEEAESNNHDDANGDDDHDDDANDDSYHNRDDDDDDDDDDVEEENDTFNLYERLEHILVVQNNSSQATEELRKFMVQHDYQQNLTEDNQVHLNLSMTFPPTVDLKKVIFKGRDYMRYVQKSIVVKPPTNEEEREYYKQRIMQEKRLIDYQIGQLRSGQKAEVGFNLSCVQPPRNSNGNRKSNTAGDAENHSMQPNKWSMAIGASTDLVYPEVAQIATLAGKEVEDQHHAVSMFVNTTYQPIPATQINLTANLSNDNESHQYTLGSTHTFLNQTAFRYGLTYLSKSPLDTPLIINLKSYRHINNIGTASVGISSGGNGQMLQWNAKLEKTLNNIHKCSAKASIGLLQGNSLEVSYSARLQKKNDNSQSNDQEKRGYDWLDDYITLPKKVEVSTVLGHFYKITAMVTHEITSLATNPTLGFGLEHNISLGQWAWIWEICYNNSTFKIPIPLLHLGSVSDPSRFYAGKLYYGVYCLFMQSVVADLLQDQDQSSAMLKDEYDDDDDGGGGDDRGSNNRKEGVPLKTKNEGEKQLALMETVAEKKKYLESQRRDGLVILKATYWQNLSHNVGDRNNNNSVVHEVISMDATKQLQFWVTNGKLVTPGVIPKACWMGFYNLQTDKKFKNHHSASNKKKWWEPIHIFWRRLMVRTEKRSESGNQHDSSQGGPKLTVRYSYKSSVYEITVGEIEALILPCTNDEAEHLGDSNFIQ